MARTGLLDHEALSDGFDPLTVSIEANDHKAYYPGAVPLNVLISGGRSTGKLLGAQILGSRKAEISKRIDIVATALFQHAAVEDLNDWISATRRRSAVLGTPCKWRRRPGRGRRVPVEAAARKSSELANCVCHKYPICWMNG